MTALAATTGISAAGAARDRNRARYYRQRTGKPAPQPRGGGTPPRALRAPERLAVRAVLHRARWRAAAPAEVYAPLLEAGTSLCAARTMYRRRAAAQQVRERRAQARHPR